MNDQHSSPSGGVGRVLVTGGTGFIGSYIIRELLVKGYTVRALHRGKPELPFYISPEIAKSAAARPVEWVAGDVLDVVSLGDAMQDVDCVIHSAGIISFSRRDKQALYKTNIEGTANMVNVALEQKIKRFVHISSVAAIGRLPGQGMVSEERKWEENKTNTQYAFSKHHAELEVWRGMAEGLNAVVLNPSTVLGYGDWNESSCRIFKNVYDEFPWYPTGVNGYVDVTDVARVAVLLMESDLHSERYLVNGDNWSFQQLFNTIADNFGKKRPHRKASPLMGKIAWRAERVKSFFTRRKPLLTKETAAVSYSQTYFDNQKIRKALPGFSFTPLEQSIRDACKKYLGTINQV